MASIEFCSIDCSCGKFHEGFFYHTTTMLSLLDSGTTGCWIASKNLPMSFQGQTISKVSNQTLAGTFTSTQEVTLQQVLVPEFH